MTNLLVRLFVRHREDAKSPVARQEFGQLSGLVGIVSNLLLFAIKLAVSLWTGSIAILADAVNNLSDSASSVITLAAFRLSAMPADEEHPYGHARFEYISGMVVSCIIVAIGFQFLVSSVRKTLTPEPILFSPVVAALLVGSILLKLWQSIFYRNIARRIDSGALLATSTDSRNDVISTLAVLVSAIIAHYTGILLDGPMGILVALFVIWSGISMLRETMDPLLGPAPDRELVERITGKILSYPGVCGLHDLMVHNYGPDRCYASVHVEFPASQDIMISHEIIDEIERDFREQEGIQMVIHLDPVITDDPRLTLIQQQIESITADIDPRLSIHDFRVVWGQRHTNLIFDVTVPPRFPLSDKMLRARYDERIARLSPAFHAVITIDRSYISS